MNIAESKKRSLSRGDWLNLVLGLWVIVSPFVLGFERNSAGMWGNIAGGAAVMLFTLISATNEAVRGFVVLLGVWLFLSPFVLGFSGKAFLSNNIVMAFLVIAGGVASAAIHDADLSCKSARA